MYVHVPVAWLAYMAFTITAVAARCTSGSDRCGGTSSPAPRRGRRAVLGDHPAHRLDLGSAHVGHVLGMDRRRIVTTLVLLLMYIGYLAVRRTDGDPHQRSQRAAVVGLIAVLNIPIVRFSVDWWRRCTRRRERQLGNTDLDGLMLFTPDVRRRRVHAAVRVDAAAPPTGAGPAGAARAVVSTTRSPSGAPKPIVASSARRGAWRRELAMTLAMTHLNFIRACGSSRRWSSRRTACVSCSVGAGSPRCRRGAVEPDANDTSPRR